MGLSWSPGLSLCDSNIGECGHIMIVEIDIFITYASDFLMMGSLDFLTYITSFLYNHF